MKLTFYSAFQADGDAHAYLLNCRNSQLMVLENKVVNLIQDNKDEIEKLADVHPSLYQALVDLGFVVDNNADEVAQYVAALANVGNSEEYFRLILNPTMDCNLRCWYCYEEHRKGSMMSDEVFEGVKKLAERHIKNPNCKCFNLNFFGGEPLMAFEQRVWPLIMYCKSLCKQEQIDLLIHFTTNAVLLTPERVDRMVAEQLNVSFQIPMDGGASEHDKTKILPSGKGTYQIVVRNVKYALSKGLGVMLRFNYTAKNIDSFHQVLQDFEEYAKNEHLNISIQRIWQETNTDDLREKERELIKSVKQNFLSEKRQVGPVKCYADSENCIIVNYDGRIFKCTARDFTPDNAEGVLSAEGFVAMNERYQRRLKQKYQVEECLHCNIWPICHTCTQHKLEWKNQTNCSLESKEERLRNYILDLID